MSMTALCERALFEFKFYAGFSKEKGRCGMVMVRGSYADC